MAPRLTCHPGVLAQLRELYPPPPAESVTLMDVARLNGIDVFEDPAMAEGEWKLADGERVISSCLRMPDGQYLVFTPGGR